MHFAEDPATGSFFIRHYEPGCLLTANRTFVKPVVLFQEQAFETLLPDEISDLNASHIQAWVDLHPQLILLGTGIRQVFPDAALFQELYAKRMGIEMMNTSAACRTFNLLVSEGRKVLAALFV